MDSTVSIGGYVDLHHVEIWVTPYTSGIDELRIFDSDEANFIMRYRAYESNDGMGKLRITKTSNPQAAWSDVAGVLNMMQYRFVDDVSESGPLYIDKLEGTYFYLTIVG